VSVAAAESTDRLALLDGLARVRAALERHAGGEARVAAEPYEAGDDSAFARLVALFGLTPFERDVLLLCAGSELDGSFEELCARAHGDPLRHSPTFGLALAALEDPHWDALAPAAPLRLWRLVEVGAGTSLVSSPLRIDERVLHYVAGVTYLEPRLAAGLERIAPADGLPPSQARLADLASEHLTRARAEGKLAAVQLCGGDRRAKAAVAASASASAGLPLYRLDPAAVPPPGPEREQVLRAWEREDGLSGAALLIEAESTASEPARLRELETLAGRLRLPLFVSTQDALPGLERAALRLDVEKPSPAEQRRLWAAALGVRAPEFEPELAELATQFSLSAPTIEAVAARAQAGDGDLRKRLWDDCRAEARPRLDDLAQRIEPAATWDDLVLPQAQREVLREIAVHVRRRNIVYDEWGFRAKSDRGLGISALFSGPSGTGKTMAAEVLAGELRLDLYRIDLSSVVSKYIGETEKNLRRVFDAAEEGGAVLLFDEADALFGKRSEVKDSHDRYANIEVSYLLQRMEAYRGLAILTTNMRKALDPAFLRRIRFVVRFPFPDAQQRAEIWRRIFPQETPTEALDLTRLAALNLTGGNIRNVALAAAFLAADDGGAVTMAHLQRAAQSEHAKLERPFVEAEAGQ
jgi:hypothetical protein